MMKNREVASAVSMASTGAIVFLLLPLLVGQMIEDLGLDSAEAGQTASVFFASYFLSSASAFLWVHKIQIKNAAIIAYGLMIAGLFGASILPFTMLLIAGLAIAGLGSGMLYAVGVSILGAGENEARNFGVMLAGQQMLAALLFLSIPVMVAPEWGLQGSLLSIALAALLLSFTVRWLSPGLAIRGDSQIVLIASKPELSTLLAMLIHFTALSALWAFVERIGTDSSLQHDFIGNALAFSMLGGLIGAAAASVQGNKYGSPGPIWLSAILFVIVNAAFYGPISGITFVITTFLLSLAWNYSLAYQMTVISQVDVGNRFTVLIPAAQSAGAMIGPALGGVLMLAGSSSMLLVSGFGVLVASSILGYFGSRTARSV